MRFLPSDLKKNTGLKKIKLLLFHVSICLSVCVFKKAKQIVSIIRRVLYQYHIYFRTCKSAFYCLTFRRSRQACVSSAAPGRWGPTTTRVGIPCISIQRGKPNNKSRRIRRFFASGFAP